MSTEFINDQWRLPNEENKSKVSNYSMQFDGSSRINCGTANTYNEFTLSAWIKKDSTAPNYAGIFGTRNSTAVQFPYLLSLDAGGYVRLIAGGTTKVLSNNPISNDTWYHVVGLGDGTNLKLYINGQLQTATATYTTQSANNYLMIGGQFNTDSTFLWVGQIDGVAIFNYALSSSQVTTLYGSSSTGIGNPMSLSPKPVAFYQLGDKSAFNSSSYLIPNSSLKDFVFDFVGAGTSSSGPHINLGNDISLSPSSEITVSIWIKTDSNSPLAASGYLDKYNVGGYLLDFGGSSGTNKAGIKFGSSGTRITSTTVVADQKWHNILFTCDNTTLRFYVDGNEEVTASATIADLTSTEDLKIGGDGSSIYFFDGKLSNTQIFNTALSATDVETLYNNGSPLTSMSGYTSLQGWWKLDASATYDGSNWTIEDHAGSNDGTSSGMTQANLVQSDLSFTSGYSPYALAFDGVNDYINLDSFAGELSTGDAYGLSVWFKGDGNNNTDGVLFSAHTSSRSNVVRLLIRASSGSKIIWYLDGGNNGFFQGDYDNNKWHNVVVTKSTGTSTLTLYIDGSSIGTISNCNPDFSNATLFSIGQEWDPSGTGDFFSGQISNVSVWNAELTSAQVTEIYSEGVPQNLNNHSAYSNLVSWWQLGSNSSFNTNWTVLDEKGSNNGTSVNMTEVDIVDGVGSYANGLSSGMGGDEVIGDAPYSTANSLSVNMDVEDRVTDTPS